MQQSFINHNIATMNFRKGTQIKFIGGKYQGHTGWCDPSKKSTTHYVPVIIKISNEEEIATRVKKTNVSTNLHEEPNTYEEALLQQHPDIEATMNKLVIALAKCRIDSVEEVMQIFEKKLVDANSKTISDGTQGNLAHCVIQRY